MIDIKSKIIPAQPRSKNYPTGTVVVKGGGGNTTVVNQNAGSAIKVIKSLEDSIFTENNVLSSLRTLLEMRKLIIAQTDNETVLSDDNAFSSLRTMEEVNRAIEDVLKTIEATYLNKNKADTANKLITFIEGLISKGLITAESGIKLPSGAALYSAYTDGLLSFAIDENGFVIYEKGTANKWSVITHAGAEFQNLVIKFLAQITDLEVSNKATTLDLVVQALAKTHDLTVDNTADIMHGIIREYLTSESFVSGFLGSGFKIWKDANGDWNGEFDKLTVRKIFTVFELAVQKVVHQGGMVIRSAAGGKLKKVTDGGTYWKCEHDSTDDFLTDDQVLCQTFTGVTVKRYWRKVTSAGAGYFNLSKTDCEAGSANPEAGDDVAVLGNRTNTDRQSAQIDCAVGVNAPYRDDYAGINSYSLVGKLINRTGNLSGITDPDFGVLSGSGLIGMNAYLKGVFRLKSSGKLVEDAISDAQSESNAYTDGKITTVETNFEIREGQISSKVTQATTAATQASGYATSAQGSASTASTKASEAAGSASTATTKATAASNSATAAAGSATTAGQKAADAAGSATAAQDAADDAATILSQVTTKESSINQTASNITLQVKDVTTKVTTATNAANTATTKAGEASTSATNAANSANQASNILTTVVQKETSINQTAQAIELKAVRAESAAGRAESAEASINLKADGIVLQASSQAAQSAVNGVQAGGENLLRNGDFAAYSTNNSIGWDNSLNGTYVISYWGSGYNSGVGSPTIGYHAHLNTSKFGWPVLEFINKNSIYNLSHRWMGISSSVYKKEKLLPGQQYTFSADVMIDTAGVYIHGGIYSARIGSSFAFNSGQYTLAPASINTWQRVSYTFTLDANIDLSQGVSFYIYSHSGAEGIAWVKNVSLQLGNKGSYVRCDADVDVDAQTKADAAKSAAISTAATDATTKANTAESNAKNYANSTFTTKTEFSSQLSVLNNSISAKVSQTDFNSLSTRVSSAEQKITSDAIISTVSSTITTAKNEAINAAAADATTKANAAKSSAVSTAATDATTKANTAESNAKTYANNTFTSLTTYNTKIAQLESSISLKADSTTVNGINTRLSSAEAKITSDAINLTVKSQITTAVNDVQVGGRNLLTNSNFANGISGLGSNGYTSATKITSDLPVEATSALQMVCPAVGKGCYRFLPNRPILGVQYNVSFYAKSSVAQNASIVFEGNPCPSSALTTSWQFFTYSFKCSDAFRAFVIYPSVASTIYITNIKIEQGNKATDWTPAPEDVDASIALRPTTEEIKSQFTMDSSGISMMGKKIALTGLITFSSLDSSTQSTINGKATTGYVDTAKSAAISAAATDATTKANNAQSTAISTAATDATTKANSALALAKTYSDTLKNSLGSLAYLSAVSLAKLDSTIVEGGYIKTSLIDANAIITGSLLAAKIAATDITTTRLTVSEGCTVGGFSIGSNRIGISASPDNVGSDGMFLYSSMIGFNAGSRQAIIGTYNTLGTSRLGQFIDTTSNYLPNVGIAFDIRSTNNGNRNYAFLGNGNGVLNGFVSGYGFREYSFAANNQYSVVGTLTSEFILVYFNYSNCAIVLPTLASMCDTLGISYTKAFTVRLTVISTAGNSGKLYGRSSSGISGISGYNYPELRDWNNAINNGGFGIDQGDSYELCMFYDGSSTSSVPSRSDAYRAYIINRQN